MKSRWSDEDRDAFVRRYGDEWAPELAERVYTARLLGAERGLVLHGGGNVSVKTTWVDRFGDALPAIFVKGSGHDLAAIGPEGHAALDLINLRRVLRLDVLTDEAMIGAVRACLFDWRAPTPSMEALVHAVIPGRFVDHTHADAILALTNQAAGEDLVRAALGKGRGEVIVLPYVMPGFALAQAVSKAIAAEPDARVMVMMNHGIFTWGDTAREAYEAMISAVSRAEALLARDSVPLTAPLVEGATELAEARLERCGPILRGLLALPTGSPDRPWQPPILQASTDEEILGILAAEGARELVESPVLTTDHIIRTKASFLWTDEPESWEDDEVVRESVAEAIARFRAHYEAYLERHDDRMPIGIEAFDSLPRVVAIPGLGLICAGGDVTAAGVALDIARHNLRAKSQAAGLGAYAGLSEEHLFDMEYRPLQHAKLDRASAIVNGLAGRVALVTGAAGAIGAGIAHKLLAEGCHVVVTDLPGERLDALGKELRAVGGPRVLTVPMDVTDEVSVALAFGTASRLWGGVDLVIPNAGVAMVRRLEEMELEDFRRLERVNVEGTLLVVREAARHFRRQGIGGDIVVVSTKNVFCPGAEFGAYSATKAGSHQIARIASLELAPMDVRVNMVSPDAVFSHGEHRSGLWNEVGPGRMKSRGLDQDGLEDYYKNRNLLKARVTAEHVANAVLFFATRQTPTTGATIPVDGGLPDSTPR